jgi:hypothetical protein
MVAQIFLRDCLPVLIDKPIGSAICYENDPAPSGPAGGFDDKPAPFAYDFFQIGQAAMVVDDTVEGRDRDIIFRGQLLSLYLVVDQGIVGSRITPNDVFAVSAIHTEHTHPLEMKERTDHDSPFMLRKRRNSDRR